MKILVDTHTIFWFFTADRRISNKAKSYFSKASRIFIPTIVLLELLYLMRKIGMENQFIDINKQLKTDSRTTFVSLDLAIVEAMARNPEAIEMHDHIIVTSAKLLKLPLITKDETIQKVYPKTIW